MIIWYNLMHNRGRLPSSDPIFEDTSSLDEKCKDDTDAAQEHDSPGMRCARQHCMLTSILYQLNSPLVSVVPVK